MIKVYEITTGEFESEFPELIKKKKSNSRWDMLGRFFVWSGGYFILMAMLSSLNESYWGSPLKFIIAALLLGVVTTYFIQQRFRKKEEEEEAIKIGAIKIETTKAAFRPGNGEYTDTLYFEVEENYTGKIFCMSGLYVTELMDQQLLPNTAFTIFRDPGSELVLNVKATGRYFAPTKQLQPYPVEMENWQDVDSDCTIIETELQDLH